MQNRVTLHQKATRQMQEHTRKTTKATQKVALESEILSSPCETN